ADCVRQRVRAGRVAARQANFPYRRALGRTDQDQVESVVETDGIDRALDAKEVHWLAGLDAPDADAALGAAGRDQLAVRANGPGGRAVFPAGLERVVVAAGAEVPQARAAIGAGGGGKAAVRRKRDRFPRAAMGPPAPQRLPRGDIP